MKNITVSDKVWKWLVKARQTLKFTNNNEVIKYLIAHRIKKDQYEILEKIRNDNGLSSVEETLKALIEIYNDKLS